MKSTGEHKRKLTPKQERFVQHYSASGNATEAARLAGYRGTPGSLRVTGSQLLTNPNVISALHELNSKTTEKLNCTREDRIKFLSDVMLAKVPEPDGDAPVVAVRVKACETLARIEGDMVTRVEATVEAHAAPQFDLSQLTADQVQVIECLQVFALPSTPYAERAQAERTWKGIQSWSPERKAAVFERKTIDTDS